MVEHGMGDDRGPLPDGLELCNVPGLLILLKGFLERTCVPFVGGCLRHVLTESKGSGLPPDSPTRYDRL